MFTNEEDLRAYVFAGRAVLTVVSPKTRYTFRVRAPKDAGEFSEVYFVDLLTGPDNTSDYEFLGTMRAGAYAHSRKSRVDGGSPGAVAAGWFFGRVARHMGVLHGVRVHHEGACGRCGRALTDPESIERGLGPVCAEEK